MRFAPIAIVGRACLLPGAHSPEALFAIAREGRDVLSDAPAKRWRVPDAHVVTADAGDASDRTWTRRGGYVDDFTFDPSGLKLPAEVLSAVDPLTQWVVDTGRRALADARVLGDDHARTGTVIGNLSLPSSGAARFAEMIWLGELAARAGVSAHPFDRFNSGLPAHTLAQALGLGLGGYCLDAACASSLYAIEHACRALQSGEADRMLAGAVNRADDLFLHIGFCALGAMSKTGQSRPFHRDADGLLPGEGAGFVVLERLDDAIRNGRTIHGVIRGVGLANDGRGKGLLAPSAAGQERSMRLALAMAGLSPSDVPYIECHATGTPVGDGTELASMRAVYGDDEKRIGSLKGNVGHLITAAGVAGLIKLLEALREGVTPPTPHQDARLDALLDSPFQTLDRAEPWRGPRRAALSAFGFGGNDAHLIVELVDETPREFVQPSSGLPTPRGPEPQPKAESSVVAVVVGLGARVGPGQSAADFERALSAGTAPRAETVRIPMKDLRFPPDDLKKSSAQQTMLLAAALEATRGVALPRETTGVFVGYQCDPEIARWGARWRAASWAEALGAGDDWTRAAKDAFVPPLEAQHVLGTLPNIPANRISSQLDLMGPSFTTSAEEQSGLRALALAVESLERGDLDCALVGAVDLSTEPVHDAALRALGQTPTHGDAAVMLVLKRRADAEREGLPILGEIRIGESDAPRVTSNLPRAHAAVGLVEVAAALIRATHTDTRRLAVDVDALGAASMTVEVHATEPTAAPFAEATTEKTLDMPAHLPPVALPALTASENRAMQTQKMAPAPALPPTHFDGPPAPPRPVEHLQSPSGHPTPRGPGPHPQAETSLSAGGTTQLSAAPKRIANTPVALLAEHQARVAEAHTAFIQQQAQLHQQFLATIFGAPAATATPVPVRISQPVHVHAPAPTPPLQSRSEYLPPPAGQPTEKGPEPQPKAEASVVAEATTRLSAVPRRIAPTPTEPAPRTEALPLAFRPTGPSFDRAALEIHASGRISEIFGPDFAKQDGYAVQVRMPEPPLLLADRCTGMEAEPGSMKKGTCWTETDVREDSWYLHDGHMPAGIMVESGQADLFLISYLGADFLNRGERAYRLLGCEMTWHGDLPKIGETLAYDIHVDGHAAQGDVRLFFFHYDCHVRREDGSTRPALSVRGGQAGFFTEGELAESEGILWKPETQEIVAGARVDPPAVPLEARRYSREEVEAFADGRPWDCFGDGFLRTKTHTRTPRIQDGRMLFLDTVEVDPRGGPWGRGYLKAVTPISPDDWYFDGHFKNDPCMPGTLMLEGCVQAMAFYLSAMGYTVDRDGWRFQPIAETKFDLRCRGQVIPSSKELTYEVFVEEVHDGPVPKLYADLLCTVDGLGAFHARRFGLELTPSWPMTDRPALMREGKDDPRAAVASHQDSAPFRFDQPSLLACAWGQPSTAFGPMYERFDGHRRTPRLPGPPYHFLSRVTKVDGAMGGLESKKTLEFEYDIPEDAWYFDENGARVMPFAVLLEAALQPCGWTASYVGSTLTSESDFLFRNLDGKGTIHAEVFPDSGTLHTTVTIKNISRSSGMIIVSFDVHCRLGDVSVYTLDTVFGFFPPEAFEDQAGLPTDDTQRAALSAPSNVDVDLTARPARFYDGTLRLAEPMLLMIDRITRFDAKGGDAGLGVIRAEKDVDAGEWFFKAHFYQDPVQPGSLGIEAMLQALQAFMIETDMGQGIAHPRFEAIATQLPHVWKYRGQVVPEAKVVTTTLEIVETGTDERGAYALADASLWVDGKRIYEAKRLGMRIVGSAGDAPRRSRGEGEAVGASPVPAEEILDPGEDPWLGDHRPTHTAPALPMMSIVDRMMAAVRRERPDVEDQGLHDLEVERWVVVNGPTRTRTEIEGDQVRFLVWRDANDPRLSRFEVAAHAKIGAPAALEEIAPLGKTERIDPYAGDRLFHGPAFHYVRELEMGAHGARALLDVEAGSVPPGTMHQGLLDAITHLIPHDDLASWSDRVGTEVVGYPRRLDIRFRGEPPTSGVVRAEARFVGFDGDDPRFPIFRAQLLAGDRVYADLRLVEILMPKGPIGAAEPTARRRFLTGEPVPGVGLTTREGDTTRLDPSNVALSDWFPGTVEAIYGTRAPRDIAIAEHVARERGVHPRHIRVIDDLGVDAHLPLTAHPVEVTGEDPLVVRDAGAPFLDISPVSRFWRDWFAIGSWPVEELYYALVERFVSTFVVEDPDGLAALHGRSVLYLANHQTGIESLIFSIVASALQGVPTLTLAKTEHRTSWLGRLIQHCFTWPGAEDPGVIAYFDRSDPQSLVRIASQLADTAAAKSLMVHVEGTRAHAARHRVETMSGIFCDLAINAGVPIVPVRFSGGLPVEPVADKLEYPVDMGRQDYHLGAPILPEELAALPLKPRIARVVDAINALGPSLSNETPLPGDPAFAQAVTDRVARTQVPVGLSTIVELLSTRSYTGPHLTRFLDAVDGERRPTSWSSPEDRWLDGLLQLFR